MQRSIIEIAWIGDDEEFLDKISEKIMDSLEGIINRPYTLNCIIETITPDDEG